MRYSKTNLTNIETIFKAQGYTIRYEKGNFSPDYCLLNSKKVIVINKFLDLRQRIDSFCQIASKIEPIDFSKLSTEEISLWEDVSLKSSQFRLVA